ncbi:CRISPR-associated protein Cas4 [Marinicrinis sediminis]|uniref:CRISPR-associated exonuclease Cas4 n=1 Tax=Marinicrinis sediminis TaxID=1652465 RepID=A0ABW5R8N4_9BACL
MSYLMPVTGTDIWYYFICKRESWLMAHEIAPDQEDENVDLGRFIHEYRYSRGKKEIEAGHIKMDRLKKVNGELVVQEVKKSSTFIESARYQLLYYLDQLRQMGINARGELLFPEERKKERVDWTQESKQKLEEAVSDIRSIAKMPVPPEPKKITFCRKCAYREYCWAEG